MGARAIGTAAFLLAMSQFLLGAALPPLLSGLTTSPSVVGLTATLFAAVAAAVRFARVSPVSSSREVGVSGGKHQGVLSRIISLV